ncbi:hypothetical protein D3C72_2227620 [compost metagenome]
MGNLEARFVDQAITEQQDVEVQRARSPAFKALATLAVFDGLQGIQQFQWRQRAVECGHRIGVARLSGKQ